MGREMTRRDFVRLAAISSTGLLAGCAVNPVTGKSQLMLVSEEQERSIDKANSPHQFSADYGALQDTALNAYIDRTGKAVAASTHRPNMPYSFRGVNATYVNAYAFPGGSIACTRGILLALEDEAELAALLGHELGHVNARHTAQQMSKGMLVSTAVGGIAVLGGTQSRALGQLAGTLGNIGAGALLASYSRDNEREADALGLEYMVRSGYNPQGMVGLMDILRGLSKHKPSALELMFATHPMSDERYRTVVKSAATQYASAREYPLYRDRYMDHTAGLRSIKGAIEEMQKGETAMGKKDFSGAEKHFQKALRRAPQDYAGLVMMARCELALNKYAESRRYAEQAQQVYPREAQAYHISGISKIMEKDFASAHGEFSAYDRLLPGNPNTVFLKGYALEGMRHREDAAKEYARYLNSVSEGEQAQYAYGRLVEWGYVRPAFRRTLPREDRRRRGPCLQEAMRTCLTVFGGSLAGGGVISMDKMFWEGITSKLP
jgi:predicted Zn-dependent protease